MKPEEAIELLRSMQNPKQDYANLVCAPAFCTGYRYVYPEPEDYAIEEAISALKEIQQYRKIGTAEECWEAVEKQKSEAVKNKKLLIGFPRRPYCIQGDCPKCGCKEIKATDTDYCYACGQHLKWDN